MSNTHIANPSTFVPQHPIQQSRPVLIPKPRRSKDHCLKWQPKLLVLQVLPQSQHIQQYNSRSEGVTCEDDLLDLRVRREGGADGGEDLRVETGPGLFDAAVDLEESR